MTNPTTMNAGRSWMRVVLVACTLTVAQQVPGQPTTTDTAFVAAIRRVRSPVGASACGLTGEGGTTISAAASSAQFTVLGEAHGVNDVPRFAGSLFCHLTSAGYRHLAIEVGPAWGPELGLAAASSSGAEAIRRISERWYPGPPFYTLREEAVLLAAAAKATGGAPDLIWGLDYDVTPEAILMHRLTALASRTARPAVLRLRAVAESTYTAALAASNPGGVFAFVGSRALVDSVRRLMRPTRGSEPDRLLATLETTLTINSAWSAGRGYESNVLRSENLRRTFAMHYARAASRARIPRVMIKVGASHAYRGRGLVNTFDVGALVPELATMNGTSSVGILLIPGHGSQQALFDVRTFSYTPVANVYGNTAWTRPFYETADSTAWTVFDLRALRPDATRGALGSLTPATLQAIFGFDFLVILGGSKPSEPLTLARPSWAAVP